MNDDLEHELTLLVRLIRCTIEVFFKFVLFLAISAFVLAFGVFILSFLRDLFA